MTKRRYDPVFSARVPAELLTRVRAFAAERNVPPSVVARTALHFAVFGDPQPLALVLRADSPTTGDPEKDLALVREALGLPPDADNATILARLQALLAATDAPMPDPTQAAALSRATLAAIKKRGISEADFRARKQSAVKRFDARTQTKARTKK